MENNKRNIRSNKNQIKHLIDYMLHHQYFATGVCRTSFEIQQHNEEWKSLKDALNALGPERSVEQWRTCWRDQKRRARIEVDLVTKARNEPNSSAEMPCLSEDVVKILSSIGHEIPVKVEESPNGSGEDSVNISVPVVLPSAIATKKSGRLYRPTSAAPNRPPKRRRVLMPSRTVVPTKTVLPSAFVNSQMELNQLVKDLVSEVREGNAIKRELLSEMKQQNMNLKNLSNSSTATIEIKQERDSD